jgi:integrase
MESKMRVAKMGYTQRVTKKDKKGRITSSWVRVRIVVPDGLSPSLPAPYTGKKHLTKKAENDHEAAAWTERFLAMIAQAAGRSTALKELAGLDSLIARSASAFGGCLNPELTRQAPTVLRRFLNTVDLPVPVAKGAGEPVIFESMIERWAKYTNAPKKGRQDMETKCGVFTAYLGHDDMAKVTFENCRDYRDKMIEEGKLSPRSISNHLKALKALFVYALDNEPDRILSDPMSRVKFDRGASDKRPGFTDPERARVLVLARECRDPVIKWCNLLAAYGGQRNDELASAHSGDFECVNGIWVMRIRTVHRSKDQRIKTTVSNRTMPLHSAILREDFLDYWRSVGDGPLFPQVELDGYGRRSGKMTAAVNEWLHETVKTDKTFYSHRHSFETFLRSASADPTKPCTPDIERYLMAHSSSIHAGYGDWLVPDLKAAIECIPDPLGRRAIPLADAAE